MVSKGLSLDSWLNLTNNTITATLFEYPDRFRLLEKVVEELYRAGVVPGSPKWANAVHAAKYKTQIREALYWPGTAWDLLQALNTACCGFHTREGGTGKASNGELKRWFMKNSVWFLGRRGLGPQDQVGTFYGLILFPKGQCITLL